MIWAHWIVLNCIESRWTLWSQQTLLHCANSQDRSDTIWRGKLLMYTPTVYHFHRHHIECLALNMWLKHDSQTESFQRAFTGCICTFTRKQLLLLPLPLLPLLGSDGCTMCPLWTINLLLPAQSLQIVHIRSPPSWKHQRSWLMGLRASTRSNRAQRVEPKSRKWDVQHSPFTASITSAIDLSALKF